MKRLAITISALCTFCAAAMAKPVIDIEVLQDDDLLTYEIWEGMPYREVKKIYDYRDWAPQPDDPYSPVAAGLCSFLIPGLGQIISGEAGAGLGYLGGEFLSMVAMGFGPVVASVGLGTENGFWFGAGFVLTLGGVVSCATLYVSSIVGAYRMAARKNLLFRDLHSEDVSFTPGLTLIPSPDGRSFAPGVSLKFEF